MKLLITGTPKSGKTTLIIEALQNIPHKSGFATEEIMKNGRRAGFMVRDSHGRTAVLAQTEKLTPYKVGRYYVQPEVLTPFINNLSSINSADLLYIDEIGQMQLYSEQFKDLLQRFLNSTNDFVGTITSVYSSSLIEHIRVQPDILLFCITKDNRESIRECLGAAVVNRDKFNALQPASQQLTLQYARKYLASKTYMSFRKLFANGLSYYLEHKVEKIDSQTFRVKGNNGDHIVQIPFGGAWSCDCPLSRGEGHYKVANECSHLQAASLFSKNPPE